MDKHILITNDDGINSPGLLAAVTAAHGLGDITVIAPSHQQTGMGRSMQGGKDECLQPHEMKINGQSIAAYHCDGSPALVVQHGLNVLFPDDPPDLLISGINYGENIGLNITQSGTVGAAMEAACKGIPSLAVSLQTEILHHHVYGDLDWQAACHFLTRFARRMLRQALPPGVDILKVDVPAKATHDTPWRITSLEREAYYKVRLENPSLKSTIGQNRLIIDHNESVYHQASDAHAVAIDKVVSVTPLTLDMTAKTPLTEWLHGLA